MTIKSISISLGESVFLYCDDLTKIVYYGRTEPECYYDSENTRYCNYGPFCVCPNGSTSCSGTGFILPTITFEFPNGYTDQIFCQIEPT